MRYFILKIANNFREDMLIIIYRSLNKSIQNICLQRSELRWTSFIVWQRIFFVRQQSVNIWQFKRYDFIIFTSYKLNIELNEQIFMNLYCSVLLAKHVVICCSSSVRKIFPSVPAALPSSDCPQFAVVDRSPQLSSITRWITCLKVSGFLWHSSVWGRRFGRNLSTHISTWSFNM